MGKSSSATKILGSNAILAIKTQVQRFENMSILFSKSPHLATDEANAIAHWGSRLIGAIQKVQNDAHAAAVESQKQLQADLGELKAEADTKKRKIAETNQLDSPRTLLANLRLIFGPPKETENRSRATQASRPTMSKRINTIREMCESYPNGVISLATSYPTKTWTQSRPEVFEGIINSVKQEIEQDWPEDIIDIMDDLQARMPMCAEFQTLKSKVSQPKGLRRPSMANHEISGMNLSGAQDTPTMNQLPSLREMPFFSTSVNGRPQHSRNMVGGHGKSNFIGTATQNKVSTSVQQGFPLRSPSNENREFKDMYTNAPVGVVSILPQQIRTAIENSALWKWERGQGLQVTGCLATLFPKSNQQDVSFTIWCGNKDGYHINEVFGLQLDISS